MKFIKTNIKFIILLILVITIIFNFSIKPYAEFVLAGLSIKLIATVLASMGILTFVNNNGGVESFFNGFVDYMETVKGKINFLSTLGQIAMDSILNNSKAKVSSLIASINEFYNSWASKIRNPLIEEDIFETKPNVYDLEIFNLTDTFLNNGYATTKKIVSGHVIFDDGFNKITFNSEVRWNSYYGTRILDSSILINGVRLVRSQWSVPNTFAGNTSIDVQYQFGINTAYIAYQVVSYSNNTVQDNLLVYNYDDVLALTDKPTLPVENVGIEYPLSKTVPLGLAMPWEMALVNQTEVIGKNIEELLEYVSSISLDAYVEKLAELPKSIIDSLPATEVIYDEQGLVSSIAETILPELVPDIKEQTGLLEGIIGGIATILSKLENIFTDSGDPIELDFNPLSGIVLKEKFPFSLPWDLTNSISLLVAAPTPPKFELPILGEVIDIDFTQFETWAQVSRVFTTLIFIVTLIILTKRFLG